MNTVTKRSNPANFMKVPPATAHRHGHLPTPLGIFHKFLHPAPVLAGRSNILKLLFHLALSLTLLYSFAHIEGIV